MDLGFQVRGLEYKQKEKKSPNNHLYSINDYQLRQIHKIIVF